MQIVHILNWCTWLAHTLCKALIWNYKNCWAQPWLSFRILQVLRWSWECIRQFFLTNTGFCFEIFKYALAISLLSCDQAAYRTLLSVCLSVCLTFFTMFPSSYHHEIFRTYYHWPTWCPCKRSRSEVKGRGHTGQKIADFDPNWAFPDCNSS